MTLQAERALRDMLEVYDEEMEIINNEYEEMMSKLASSSYKSDPKEHLKVSMWRVEQINDLHRSMIQTIDKLTGGMR